MTAVFSTTPKYSSLKKWPLRFLFALLLVSVAYVLPYSATVLGNTFRLQESVLRLTCLVLSVWTLVTVLSTVYRRRKLNEVFTWTNTLFIIANLALALIFMFLAMDIRLVME